MTILALEFSSERRSVALVRDGQLLAETFEIGGRATTAFSLIEKILAEARLERNAITAVAVGLGPGSYTGIRAAIAMAQGWQLARNVRMIGISSVEAIAAQAAAQGMSGLVNIVVDAQRKEFYLATWELSTTEHREIMPLKIVAAAEIAARQQAGELLAGPETGTIIYPSAATVAQLAGTRPTITESEALEPIYLRQTTFIKSPASGISL
jgi:tRNA threonylcarbamoyladenosine biosynthesis protein TsaB